MNKIKKAIKKTIKHWERMRKWVKRQNQKERVNEYDMYDGIREFWTSQYCPLCDSVGYCSECPLFKIGQKCSNINSTYTKVNKSKTWNEWYKNSSNMVRVLKSL